MFLSKLFKHARTKALVVLAGLSMTLGVGAAFSTVAATQQNEVVETKAAADTTYNTAQIVEHIVDFANVTSQGNDFFLRAYSIVINENCYFSSVYDAYAAGAFWSSMTYVDGAIDFSGSYEWYGTESKRSYKFYLPWWIDSCHFKIRRNWDWCQTEITTGIKGYERRWFKDSSGWKIEGYASASQTYNAPGYTMSFNSNGGTSQDDFIFREWEKTRAPSSSPTKFASTFSKWTETNSPSASAYTFGSYLTGPVTLYAQWTGGFEHGVILFKAYTEQTWFDDWTYIYVWNDLGNNEWPGVDCASNTITIAGTVYNYYLPTIDVKYMIVNKGVGGNGNQTRNIDVSASNLTGQQYYYVSESNTDPEGGREAGWKDLSLSITYYDQGGGAQTGTPSASLPTSFLFGSSGTTLPTLSKPGYTFGGWYTDSACTGTSISSVGGYGYTSNLTLYAKWSLATFIVAYNANGGTGTTSSSSFTYNTAGNIAGNGFTAPGEGYIFGHWSTDPDDEGTSYDGNQELIASDVNALFASGARTLYAIWLSGEDAAASYASSFNSAFASICKAYGTTKTKDVSDTWAAQASAFDGLAEYVQWWLLEDGRSDDTNIVKMLEGTGSDPAGKYDYIFAVYGTELSLDNFLDRATVSLAYVVVPKGPSQEQSPLTMTLWIVFGCGLAGLGAIGTAYFVSKKKKRHQA